MTDNLYKLEAIEVLGTMASSTNQKLIIHTASGSYFGDLLIKDNLSNFVVPDAFTDGIAIHHTASSEKANPEFFWMVDVTFVSDNVKNKIPSICFFIDQIVAVTIGVLE